MIPAPRGKCALAVERVCSLSCTAVPVVAVAVLVTVLSYSVSLIAYFVMIDHTLQTERFNCISGRLTPEDEVDWPT